MAPAERSFDIHTDLYYIYGMSKFYLISLNRPEDNRLERYIKDTFEKWMHYMECNWVVVSDKSVKEITDQLVPWVRNSDDRNQLLLVTELDPTNINGWLPQGAWNWIQKNQREITYKAMENPSLIDMYNCGIFSPELDRARCIKDIDNILAPYENSVSPFALVNVRNRMIDVLTSRIKALNEAR